LRGANAEATSHHQESKLKSVQEENERLKAKMEADKAEADAKFEALQKQIMLMAGKKITADNPRRGRPPRAEQEEAAEESEAAQ
jgi:hypothetical protein